MSKISVIAFANSVKVGRFEALLFQAEQDQVEIELIDRVRIKITCLKTKMVSYTSLYNAKWWKEFEDEASKPAVTKEPKKVTKKL